MKGLNVRARAGARIGVTAPGAQPGRKDIAYQDECAGAVGQEFGLRSSTQSSEVRAESFTT